LVRRVILKISGEAFGRSGFDLKKINFIKEEIKSVIYEGIRLGIVIGAGNILRGRELVRRGFPLVSSDYIGMLGTLLNGAILKEVLIQDGIKADLFSPVYAEKIVRRYDPFIASKLLDEGIVVILAGGTGLPFVTTDTTAVLRTLELGGDIFLKATKVGGVYTEDPKKKRGVKFFKFIDYDEFIRRKLEVMDLTAVALAKEKRLKIIVYNFFKKGNTLLAIKGKTGTCIG